MLIEENNNIETPMDYYINLINILIIMIVKNGEIKNYIVIY